MKRLSILISAVAAVLVFGAIAQAAGTGHLLTVDGIEYESIKDSGSAIHWETAKPNPTSASFPERGQTWVGHGAENLPCPYGIHWISNENVLTVSHCLDRPSTTVAPTTVAPTTAAPTTTASSVDSSTTSSTHAPTTTQPSVVRGSTTIVGCIDDGIAPPCASTTSTVAQQLPETGVGTALLVVWGAALILAGCALLAVRRPLS